MNLLYNFFFYFKAIDLRNCKNFIKKLYAEDVEWENKN